MGGGYEFQNCISIIFCVLNLCYAKRDSEICGKWVVWSLDHNMLQSFWATFVAVTRWSNTTVWCIVIHDLSENKRNDRQANCNPSVHACMIEGLIKHIHTKHLTLSQIHAFDVCACSSPKRTIVQYTCYCYSIILSHTVMIRRMQS